MGMSNRLTVVLPVSYTHLFKDAVEDSAAKLTKSFENLNSATL